MRLGSARILVGCLLLLPPLVVQPRTGNVADVDLNTGRAISQSTGVFVGFLNAPTRRRVWPPSEALPAGVIRILTEEPSFSWALYGGYAAIAALAIFKFVAPARETD
jgi:hypothetical protein